MKNARTFGLTKIDLINATNASVSLKTAPKSFTASGFAVGTDINKDTGKDREVGYVVNAETGEVYGTISATAIATIEAILDALDADEISLPIETKVTIKQSAKGRDFLTLTVATK